MTATDLMALAPLLVMGATVLATVLAVAASGRSPPVLAPAGTALALAVLWQTPQRAMPLLIIDGYALFFLGLILAATLAVLLLAHGTVVGRTPAFPPLLLLGALGAMAVVAANHFAALFLGLETLSIALLGLIATPPGRDRPLEAALKYLVLAGVSSAFLLFGIALTYLLVGSLAFPEIARHAARLADDPLWLAALALLVTGIGFKLSLVPFHMWAPDVYQGAPAPVTGFIAVVSKGAVLAFLLRYLLGAGAYASLVIEVLAIASMLAGNLLALLQDDVKRILAYSSIAHLGYLLLAVLAGGAVAVAAVAYYLVAYAVMTLGAFGIVSILSPPGGGDDIADLADYRGLSRRRPFLAGAFTLMLLALAGLPLTMGFFAKIYVLSAGIGGNWWPAVAALVFGSVTGLFYYLRIIAVMAQAAPAAAEPPAAPPWPGLATVTALALLLIGLGIQPAPLVRLIRLTATQVVGR